MKPLDSVDLITVKYAIPHAINAWEEKKAYFTKQQMPGWVGICEYKIQCLNEVLEKLNDE